MQRVGATPVSQHQGTQATGRGNNARIRRHITATQRREGLTSLLHGEPSHRGGKAQVDGTPDGRDECPVANTGRPRGRSGPRPVGLGHKVRNEANREHHSDAGQGEPIRQHPHPPWRHDKSCPQARDQHRCLLSVARVQIWCSALSKTVSRSWGFPELSEAATTSLDVRA